MNTFPKINSFRQISVCVVYIAYIDLSHVPKQNQRPVRGTVLFPQTNEWLQKNDKTFQFYVCVF